MFRVSPLCSLLSSPSTLHLSLFSPHHSLFLFSPFSCPFSIVHIFFSFLYIFSPQGNDQSLRTPFLTPQGSLGNLSLFPEDPIKGMSGELVWSCLYFLGPWGRIKPHDWLGKFFSRSVFCRHERRQRCLWDGCIASAGVSFLLQDSDPALALSSTLPSWRSQVVGHSRDGNSTTCSVTFCAKDSLPTPQQQASTKAALHP